MNARTTSFVGALKAEWRTGRLSLSGLSRGDRLLAIAALVVIAAACGVLILAALGERTLGPTIGVVGKYVESGIRGPLVVPVLVVPLVCLGLAVGEASVTAAAVRQGGAHVRRTLLALIVTNLALGGIAASTQGAVEVAVDLVGGNPLVSSLWRVTAVLGVGSAVALAIVVTLRPTLGRWLAPTLAAAPFVAAFITLLLGLGQQGTMTALQRAIYPDFPPVFSLMSAVLAPLLFLVGLTSALLFLLALWQATTWSRASARLVGKRLGVQGGRYWWLLPALLGMKLTWLALGLADALPPMLGGASDAWSRIRSDDVTSWTYAAILALVAGVWLLQARRPIGEKQALRHASSVVIAVALLFFVLAAIPMMSFAALGLSPAALPVAVPPDPDLATCVTGTPRAAASSFVMCLGLWLTSWQSTWILLVVIAALVAGVAIRLRRPRDASSIFLLVFGAWALPRALTAARITPPAEFPGMASLPALNAPQPETMDVVVTFGVLVLAVLWWAKRPRTVSPFALVVILVVSTLAIHGATFAPTATLAAFALLAVIFPVIYDLCFDSEEINKPGPDRGARVLADVGVRALALTLFASALAVGVSASTSTTTLFAYFIFGLPFIATITAVTLTSRTGASAARDARRQRDQVWRAALPVAAGGAVILSAALLAALLQPQVRSLYPTAHERVTEVEARMSGATIAADAVAQTLDDTAGEQLEEIWRTELAWIRENPPPDCAASLWANWRETLDDLREVGLAFAAANTLGVDASPLEVGLLQEKLTALPGQHAEHARLTQEALVDARADCPA
jgi:hypothetical protein